MKKSAKRRIVVLLLFVLALQICAVPAAAYVDYSGYVGSWYDANTATVLEIHSINGNSVTFQLSTASSRTLRVAEVYDVTGTLDGDIVTFQFAEDSWGNSGHGKLELLMDKIRVESAITKWSDRAMYGLDIPPDTYLTSTTAPGGIWIDDVYKEAINGFQSGPRAEYTANMFLDVEEDMWYGKNNQAVVMRAYELGIMAGKGNGVFDPSGNILLSEALKMACVVHHIYNGGNGVFTQGEPWYQVYIDYATRNGIIRSNDFADFTKPATRAEMAYIFRNAVPEDELEVINDIKSIPDIVESRYKDEILSLYRAGILTGIDEYGAFLPESYITRAEAAAIMTRVVLPTERKLLQLTSVR